MATERLYDATQWPQDRCGHCSYSFKAKVEAFHLTRCLAVAPLHGYRSTVRSISMASRFIWMHVLKLSCQIPKHLQRVCMFVWALPMATEPFFEAGQRLQDLCECCSWRFCTNTEACQFAQLLICVISRGLRSFNVSMLQLKHFECNRCLCVRSPTGYRTNVRCNSMSSGSMCTFVLKLQSQMVKNSRSNSMASRLLRLKSSPHHFRLCKRSMCWALPMATEPFPKQFHDFKTYVTVVLKMDEPMSMHFRFL